MSKPTTTDLSLNPFTTWNGQPVINTVAIAAMAKLDHDELLEDINELEKQFYTDGLITCYAIDLHDYTIKFYWLNKDGFELLDEYINDSLFQFLLSSFETHKAEAKQPQPEPPEAWQHLPTVNQLTRQNFTVINGKTVTNSLYLCKLFDVEHGVLGDWLNHLLEKNDIHSFSDNFISDRVLIEVSNGIPVINYFYYLTQSAVRYLINGYDLGDPPLADNEDLYALFMMAFDTAIGMEQVQAVDHHPKTRTLLRLICPVHFDLLAHIANYPFKHPVFVSCNGQELCFVERLD